MSQFINCLLICSLLVGALTTWLSPRLVSWYASPPVAIGVTCDPAMKWAMNKLVLGQIGGLVVGAILGTMVYIWLRNKKKIQKPHTLTK